jgi:hypothetical protein
MSQITRRRRNGGPRYLESGSAMSPGAGEAHCFSEDTMGVSQDPAVDPQDLSAMGAAPKGTGEEARHRGLTASKQHWGTGAARAVAGAAWRAGRGKSASRTCWYDSLPTAFRV